MYSLVPSSSRLSSFPYEKKLINYYLQIFHKYKNSPQINLKDYFRVSVEAQKQFLQQQFGLASQFTVNTNDELQDIIQKIDIFYKSLKTLFTKHYIRQLIQHNATRINDPFKKRNFLQVTLKVQRDGINSVIFKRFYEMAIPY